ncbi:MAG: hypothetical protein JXR71_06800 [Bacteroidales bacterium]|nr:hypothetical protein [Bacteroidales bacterium]
MNKKLRFSLFFFVMALGPLFSKAQTTVYVCTTNGAYGFCYGGANTSGCAYSECIKRGGQTPSVILSYPGKGHGAIAVGKSSDGRQIVGASAGYSDYSGAIARAKEECRRRGGENPRITHTFYDKEEKKEEKKPKEKPEKEQQQKDDFWSGKSDTKNNTTGKSNEDPFWEGKGSYQTNENTKSTGGNSKNPGNQFIGEVESKTKTLKIVCWDHGKEDGDRVQIRNNKSIIRSNLYLTKAKKYITVYLKWGMNRIDFKALNQGSVGTNTASFEIFDDKGAKIAKKEWSITTGKTATLLIVKL